MWVPKKIWVSPLYFRVGLMRVALEKLLRMWEHEEWRGWDSSRGTQGAGAALLGPLKLPPNISFMCTS